MCPGSLTCLLDKMLLLKCMCVKVVWIMLSLGPCMVRGMYSARRGGPKGMCRKEYDGRRFELKRMFLFFWLTVLQLLLHFSCFDFVPVIDID